MSVMKKAIWSISVNDKDATSRLQPYLLSMSMIFASDLVADELEIVINDDADLVFPKIGSQVVATLGWQSGYSARFFGEVSACDWSQDRNGSIIRISAQSAKLAGKVKERQSRSWDNVSLGQVLSDAAASAGMTIKVHEELKSRNLEYEGQDNESFLAFGQRLAREHGAAFRISGTRAVFLPRGKGVNSIGEALPVIDVVRGGNLIGAHGLIPDRSRPRFKTKRGRWYDIGAGTTRSIDVDAETGSDAVDLLDYSPDEETARWRAEAKRDEDRLRLAAGTLVIDGTPEALPTGRLRLANVRQGIDGLYTIDAVTHRLDRDSGFITEVGVAFAGDGAGQ